MQMTNGVPRTLKGWDAVLATATFPNSTVEQQVKAAGERVKAEAVAPVVQSAQNDMNGADEEAALLRAAAKENRKASKELRRKIKARGIDTKEARTELAALQREEAILANKLDALTKHYETSLFIRDHAADYLDNLFEKYPSLIPPTFPI